MVFKALPIEHGTHRGYGQHQRTGTVACAACLEGHRRHMTAIRVRLGRHKALNIPIHVLADVLAGEADSLAKFLGPEVADAVTERVITRKARAA
jgi:hypothetical protein